MNRTLCLVSAFEANHAREALFIAALTFAIIILNFGNALGASEGKSIEELGGGLRPGLAVTAFADTSLHRSEDADRSSSGNLWLVPSLKIGADWAVSGFFAIQKELENEGKITHSDIFLTVRYKIEQSD